jgi:hypothetical protein
MIEETDELFTEISGRYYAFLAKGKVHTTFHQRTKPVRNSELLQKIQFIFLLKNKNTPAKTQLEQHYIFR